MSPNRKKLRDLVEQVETRSSKKSLLLYSDKEAIKSFLVKYPELTEPFDAIIGSSIETYLSKIPFLENLRSSKLSLLATMCRFEALEANQIVFEENTPGDKLYIVISGKATVLAPQWVGNATILQQSMEWGEKRSENEIQDVIVADLKGGDHFGETALFVNVNRTCTVRTETKSLFVVVEKRTFENFCKVCPEIRDKLTTVMKQRMVAKLSSLGIPFLVGIPAESMRSLTNLVQIHEIENNEVIFRERDQGDRFYIIVHGQVKVEKDEEGEDSKNDNDTQAKSLGVLNAGNYFGEMALVSDLPRSATVTATGEGVLLSVDKESFCTIFASNSNALAEFSLRLLRGSSELKHLLAHSLGMTTFRTFLRRSVAEENVNFWIAARKFRHSAIEYSENELHDKAFEIFETYCKEGSEHQVNLPCSMRSELKNCVDKKNITPEIFDSSIDEIYLLMERDSYARFKRTPDFKEFFKCLGILAEYDDG